MRQYAKRKIDVIITLGEGELGDDAGREYQLTGYRVSAQMAIQNGEAQGQLQLRIMGLPLPLINQLTKIGPIMNQRRNNSITVLAGDEGSAMSIVYQGTIDTAYGDFQSLPDVAFNLVALSALIAAVRPAVPGSYGPVAAEVVMENLAKTMGYAYENSGVAVMLPASYFPGSALEQVKACARAANINYTVDKGKLSIWPKDGSRSKPPVLVSVETGMVGYPSFSSNGLVLTTLYNPELEVGCRAEVKSDLTVACGMWNIFKVDHVLESEVPDGQWFTQIYCYPYVELS